MEKRLGNKNMIAILLCAGFGTRMYPLTKNCAKPLLPVAGKPVLNYLMDQMVTFPGLDAVHIVSNGRFHNDFHQWRDRNVYQVPIYLHNDGVMTNEARLGAVGDLARVLDSVGIPDGAFVAGGDNILRFDLRPAREHFQVSQRSLIISLPEEDLLKQKRTGILELDAADQVIQFHEKPQHPPSKWTSPPLYFLTAEALCEVSPFNNQFPDKDAPGHFIAHLVHQHPVYAYKINGRRFDIGSMESYRFADEILLREPVINEAISSA